MARPRHASASPALEATRPSKAHSKAVRRRAVTVSEKLAARGLGAFVWRKKLDRDLSRGLVPGIVSLRSEQRRCLARQKEAAGLKVSADSRRASPPPVPAPSLARADEAAAKEVAFVLAQSRLRAGIRFAEGRPQRIDMLVGSLHGVRRCALAAFRGASAEELNELGEEIRTQADLDTANGPFWEAAKVMCDAEISKAAGAGTAESFLHSDVAADAKSVVEGKSLEELDAMQQAIAAKMAAGEEKMVDQWQEVSGLIRVVKAKKLLAQNESTCEDDAPFSSKDEPTGTERDHEEDRITDADEDGPDAPLLPVTLPAAQTPSSAGPGWRKPKYVARARSGYEWNKYNRVHYDNDHPPPKTVRGYKFVLRYPDLAAGAVPPRYTVEEDGGSSGETCIIRFSGGWPYEDVAFRVVNKDWERSARAGFRCTFDRGVLHLNFNFKRFFYRR